MSAIWGYASFGDDKCELDAMASEYKRKCKLDSINEAHFKNALIGFGLQVINTEDHFEKMPYVVDGGNTIIVSDCILDNRDELIEELINLKDRPDNLSEITSGKLICLAYEKWHFDLARHLKGLFSIAIYDVLKHKLFLCVDQCACRCLYYHADKAGVTFSTLISPIRQVVPALKENELYIEDFLCLPGLLPNITSTETPWENVFQVEAGTYVTVDTENADKAPEVTRYYSPKTVKVSHNIKKVKKQFLNTYVGAVKAAVRTSGEVSMALSGGFDSASVAALAARELAPEGKILNSYTYVPFYKDEAKSENPAYYITDESEDVKAIAAMYPNINMNFEDDGGEDCTATMDELVDVMEIPFKAYVNLHTLLNIYKKAGASGSKVFLNGQCGNSTVSYGNIDSACLYLYQKKKKFLLRKYYNEYCKLIGMDGKAKYKDFLEYLKNEATGSFDEDEYNKYVSSFVNKEVVQRYNIDKRGGSNARLLRQGSARTEEFYKLFLYSVPSFAYIGAMETKLGLYTGIVIRDATRDINVLEFCNSLPYEFFVYKGVPRYLIRGFMKDMLPKRILYPIQKSGMQSADWLIRLSVDKKRIYDIIDQDLLKRLSDDDFRYNQFFDRDAISEFVKERPDFEKEAEGEFSNLFTALVAAKYASYLH